MASRPSTKGRRSPRARSCVVALSLAVSGVAARADGQRMVVADRGSGTITVIDTDTDEAIDTIALPAGDNAPEPMYVTYSKKGDRVFVGDRGNSRVVVYDARTMEMETTVPAGAGVFHMWNDKKAKQLWVNNDVDNTTTVISLKDLSVLATVPTPADLVSMGGKPHDVILDPAGKYAYVTIVGLSGPNDYVVQFSIDTREEIGRAAVGKDPHVSLTRKNNLLYVPCQNTNDLYILDRDSLAVVKTLDIPGAHGAGMPSHGKTFYTANLPGGGTDALWTLDTRSNELIGAPVDAPYSVPHNIALTRGGKKLYLTHSGPNDKVSVYNSKRKKAAPTLIGEVTTGMNPFGLAWVP